MKPVKGEILKAKGSGPRYWKSLDELAQTPAFKAWVEREFPQGASELEGVNRRHFLKIMAASFGAAGLGAAGCRRPEQYILPYSRQKEMEIPGVPVYYATSFPDGADNIPLVVETHSNRPTKIEGNDRFSAYGGATGIFAQASVLDLYDPDRARHSSKGTKRLSKAEVYDLLASIGEKFKATDGQGLAFLAEPSTSPTRARLALALKKKFPRAIWAEYDPTRLENDEVAAERLFERRLRPHYHFEKASRVLSLDADFLNSGPGHLEHARDFAAARRVHNRQEAKTMNRLYAVESGFSVTGAMADHRLRLSGSQIEAFASLAAAEALKQKSREEALARKLRKRGAGLKGKGAWIEKCVADLLENKGKAVVVAGPHMPVAVHQLAYFLNDLMGASGNTVTYLELPPSSRGSILDLTREIERGRIDTLVIMGGNPAYNAPVDVRWKEAQKKVPEVIRFGYYFDETSLLSQFHIAATHYLESWGDGRTWDGTVVSVQPMILPLFDGFQETELLSRIGGMSETDPFGHLFKTFGGLAGETDKEKAFHKFLSDGFLEESRFSALPAAVTISAVRSALRNADFHLETPSKDRIEVRMIPDRKVLDGRYNNNGWLQECPDPMTKLTWDNAIAISPRLARELGYDPTTKRSPLTKILDSVKPSARNFNEFEMGREVAPLAQLTIAGRTVEGPVHIQPGLANYTVTVSLGYGRKKVGRVGAGTGFDVYPLFHFSNPGYARGGKIRLTGENYLLANTQEHWSMEGRAIIREGNAENFEAEPNFVSEMGVEAEGPPVYGADSGKSLQWKALHQPRGNSAYITPRFGGAQQWGMSVDLNTCIGCNACVIACQSENNIPIVGKDQVTRGREMHWIRLDRYYSSGDPEASKDAIPEDPQVSLQPMLCQQCETAPCEQVCPVNATVHDDEGLNVMVYNRCVGTRYCSNNCPYKVRRFNFFDWNKRKIGEFYEGPLGDKKDNDLGKMQKNPDVTVRMRGVMEKCTYCTQRIQEAKINQKVKARDSDAVKVPDGVIKTACEQVCPTGAIVFGDVADPATRVSKLKTSKLDYEVLGYVNTRPRTTYLAKLRNPNPAMPDYRTMPLSRMEYEKKFGHETESGHEGDRKDGRNGGNGVD